MTQTEIEPTILEKRGWNGMYRLVGADGLPVEMPYDNGEYLITNGMPPHKPSSEGKILTKGKDSKGKEWVQELYASVADLKWQYNGVFPEDLPTFEEKLRVWMEVTRMDLAEAPAPDFNLGDLVLWQNHKGEPPVYCLIVGHAWEINQNISDDDGMCYRHWHYSIQPLVHEERPDHDYWAEEDWAWEDELKLIQLAPYTEF